jgi:V/A-type H+/Na+-transporting ATPase subunit K
MVESIVLLGKEATMAIAAGLAIMGGAIGTAWVQSSVGSAAMGVIAEKPEEANKLLVWFLLPETIVVLGFAIAALLTLNLIGMVGVHA